ncbi:MAG TPA: peptide deformylase [Candidatus Angelobacter sp.]|nr:peptide deformylase [Candidatus Angelobacter sp.]
MTDLLHFHTYLQNQAASVRLKIVQSGEPVLREAARPLSSEEIAGQEIQRLIEAMKETMRDAPGVGLAAPQVGYALQLAVIEDRPEYTKDAPREQLFERERQPVPFHVIINPKLTLMGDPEIEFFEGCLSLPGFMAIVPRVREVRVECLDDKGKPRVIEASGWHARVLQHEIDHLQGTLYVDRMLSRSLTTIENYNRYWKEKRIVEVKSILRAEE